MNARLVPFPLRRQLNRVLGRGPWRLAPFAAIAAARNDPGNPGVIHTEPADTCTYPGSVALLGQDPPPGDISAASARGEADRRELYALADAGIAGSDGVVYCPRTRCAVAETVRQWTAPAERHPLLAAAGLPPAGELPGTSLSIATLDGGGFYHFMHESLPRLWLARDRLASADRVLLGGPADEVRAGWLELAGVPRERIAWLGGLGHFHCAHLLFANLPLRDSQPTPWNVHALRSLFRVAPPPAPARRLWISRQDSRNRHLTWEDDLLRLLPSFEKVVLSPLAPAEQIRLFASAAVVAGPHGAGLSHLGFCLPGTRVIELMPDLRPRPLYARLAAAAGGRHAWAAVDFQARPDNLPALAETIRRFSA
jgi:hypothetical protein